MNIKTYCMCGITAFLILFPGGGGLHAKTPTVYPVGKEIVLFPFDDYGFTFNKGVLLTLLPADKSNKKDPKHPNKPVLTKGPPGSPDDRRVYYSGTVIHIDGEFRMWYSGYDRAANRHMCYAVSKDGIIWEKPKLGLVDYNGNKDNNLLSIDGGQSIKGALFYVLHDPEDPDPSRRFKMIREMDPYNQMKAAFSADGLSWASAGGDKFLVSGEGSGLIKRDGLYYLNAHSGAIRHPVAGAHKRTMQTFVSHDFENWTTAAHMSFRRDNIPPRPPSDFEFNRGEQVHLGASLWDRGNVVLGFYGQYHNPTNDRRTATCDIGLIVSNDGLHFKEPVPDFKLVPSFEESDRAEPRLVQGQGFANVGDRTYFWYGIWTEVNRDSPTGVRLASWPRDRLGYFRPAPGIKDSHCISNAYKPLRDGARIYINADKLADVSQLRVEILDYYFRPIAGYTAEDCVPLTKPGLRVPVRWKGKAALTGITDPVRVRVNWAGEVPDARLYAVYIE